MGRGEGPGCYCYVNNLLREALDRIEGGYRAVVVDNEAGMEHLSGVPRGGSITSSWWATPPGAAWMPWRPCGTWRGARPPRRENVAPPQTARTASPAARRRRILDSLFWWRSPTIHDFLPGKAEGRSFLDLPPGESPAADAVADALRTCFLGTAA